ncbi:MAG: redox-regulated ATPase YchF [Nitrospiraceae bacterium]|nr:redox-regulated ATPase YchF [Nitrospiraceae bacterium]
MKIAIIGLSNSGKTTVFNALTRQNLETTIYSTVSGDPHFGMVKVPDSRIEKLRDMYNPKKTTYATVEYIDYIGLTKGDAEQNKRVFDLIKDADAIVHVVRAFENESIAHPDGSVDPMRDIATLELELVFADLEFVDKRLQRMEEASKKGKKPGETEKKLMLKCKSHLESELPLRSAYFDEEELKLMRPLQFISIKPEVILVNLAEHDLGTDKSAGLVGLTQEYIKSRAIDQFTKVVMLCGKIEMELAQLSPEDAQAFLADLGIQEPALNRLINVCYDLLQLISFLTVGEDEVRAWTISKGLGAQKAAGKIHSDIERGFIRAEVIHYDDLISSGSMSAARDKGLLRLEGKTYEVKDGDIINFRFNV